MRHAYPLMLDVSDRLVVLIGGGAVGVRKANGLIEAGARRLRCVAPTFHADLPAMVERIAAVYRADHLDGAMLVFAATDRADVNEAVARDARTRGILVNRADAGRDDAEPGDFVTPALLRRGVMTVTISAGSPALAAVVRDGIAGRWDERWTRMAEVMQVLRPELLRRADLPPEARTAIFRDLATEEAMNVLAGGGQEALMSWLGQRHGPFRT